MDMSEVVAEQQRQHAALFQQLERVQQVRDQLFDLQLHQWPTNEPRDDGSGGVMNMHQYLHQQAQQHTY